MNPTLLKAAIAFLPVSAWLAYSVVIFLRGKSLPTGLQLLGAGCLLLVVLTHVAEALRLFPTMRFGEAHSLGHYVDFSSAVLGLTLTPIGYVLHRRQRVSLGREPSL